MIKVVLLCLCLQLGLCSLRVCPASYFFDDQHCELCQSNCLCVAENTCDSCIPGYTLFEGECIQCPQAAGFIYGTCTGCCSWPNGTLLTCTDCQSVPNMYSFLFSGRCILSPGCFEVDSNGFCSVCREGFYTFDNKLCNQCDLSCATCIGSDSCLTCAPGYYWKVRDGGLCSVCPDGCATCSDDSTCNSCLDEFYFFSDHCLGCPSNCEVCVDGSTCTSCADDYILVSNLCISCVDSTYGGSTGCTTCAEANNFIECSECADLYFLDADNGVCRLCSDYIEGAARCRDEKTPTQCLDDSAVVLTDRYYLVGISCVHNTKSCKKISDIYGNCSSCYDGYYLQAGACTLCATFTGCDSATATVLANVCTCTACDPGYYLVGVVCQPCSVAQCSLCPANACSRCLPGLYFSGGTCASSTATNCLVAKAGSASLCAECNSGYFLGSSETCFQCQENCLSCTDKYTCSECASGWSLTEVAGSSLWACVEFPSNCVAVGEGACVLCEHGFYLESGVCLECSVELGTLGKCEGLCPVDYLINSLMVRVEQWQAQIIAMGTGLIIFIFI